MNTCWIICVGSPDETKDGDPTGDVFLNYNKALQHLSKINYGRSSLNQYWMKQGTIQE